MKKYMPYILSITLLLAIVVMGYVRIEHGRDIWGGSRIDLTMLIVCAYVMWIFIEIPVSRNDVQQQKVVSDRGTREFYGASQFLTILSALWFDSLWQGPSAFHYAGLAVFILGGALRLRAIRTLGEYYSHTVRKIEGHRIVDTGPYRFVRHPAYAGMILAHVGVVMFFFNYYTLFIFLCLLVPSIVTRIVIEEKTLMEIEGYREYSLEKKRIVPFVW